MGKMDLSNIINKCCDILRTDDGISGAMHYTEVLSWILYLKFLQDKMHLNFIKIILCISSPKSCCTYA
jgi:type I restriction-modification system DNA methylase subunit